MGFGSAVKVNTIVQRIPVYLEHKEDPCNDETVKAYIASLHLKYPDIVYRQVILESGHFQSPIYRDLNNLLGMEATAGRPTLGTNIGQRFARYNNWKESIADYAIWQATMAREVRNEEEYYYLLDKVYCPGDLEENRGAPYSTLLKQIKE
jgi:uncharacterized FlgJ-related protein